MGNAGKTHASHELRRKREKKEMSASTKGSIGAPTASPSPSHAQRCSFICQPFYINGEKMKFNRFEESSEEFDAISEKRFLLCKVERLFAKNAATSKPNSYFAHLF
ncbi:hypothetical protein EPI10_016709 [Gossypium australe]|uniref:Uncharacterized protein n=1 Tax=Gossypium australe TaxID=47621 RepID=A0A5B6VPT2_9ROSI|nr:hypothetical protein EPI10_016709 [Gossypium australe]